MITRLILESPDSINSAQLGHWVRTVVVDNPSNQWLYEPNTGRFVPPYFGGVAISVVGLQVISILNRSPAGLDQPAAIAGQLSTVSLTDVALPDAPGIPLVSPRGQFVDRNPKVIIVSFNQTLGPHGLTQRFNYTVPTGRRCQVYKMWCALQRGSAATTASTVQGIYQYTPFTGAPSLVDIDSLPLTNMVGDFARTDSQNDMFMGPGDLIAFSTIDSDTGGTVNFSGTFWGLEGDI